MILMQVCTDNNECTDDSHDCGTFSDCTNTAGSFDCKCMAGFLSTDGSGIQLFSRFY